VKTAIGSGTVTVRAAFWAAGLCGLALLFIYWDTTVSMVAIWARSDTFAHGFLILPISVWLIWIRREDFTSVTPAPAPIVVALMVPVVMVWLLAWAVDVLVVQQLALVAMLVVGISSLLGHRLVTLLWFPLVFLFFAVPMGQGLVAPMMDFTAASTGWLVRVSGIPVYQEGLYFTLPSGRWSVVEACSGVRYIIASVTVGTLYAYLTYYTWWRRLVFIAISAIVPVFANTLRAYIIVMLGHHSNMTIATGADHLVYGWVFFGLVIFILFWLGSFFREDTPAPDNSVGAQAHGGKSSRSYLLLTFALVLGVASIGPALSRVVDAREQVIDRDAVELPGATNGWRLEPSAAWIWQPPGMVGGEKQAFYSESEDVVGVVIQFSDGSFDLGEVVGSSTLFVWNDSPWRVVGRDKITASTGLEEFTVDEALLRGPRGDFVAWSWYQLGDLRTSSDYLAKFQQAAARFGISGRGTWRILLVTPVRATPEEARDSMRSFLRVHGAELANALQDAAQAGSG